MKQEIPLIFHPPIIYLLGCNLIGGIFMFIWYTVETCLQGYSFFGDAMATCRAFIACFIVSSSLCIIGTIFLRENIRKLEFKKKAFYFIVLSGILIGTCLVYLVLSDVMHKTYHFVSHLQVAAQSENLSVEISYKGQDGMERVICFDDDAIAPVRDSLSKARPYEPSHDNAGIHFFVPVEGTMKILLGRGKSEVLNWHIPNNYQSSLVLHSPNGVYAVIGNVFFEVQYLR
jgi:hypothetical protein